MTFAGQSIALATAFLAEDVRRPVLDRRHQVGLHVCGRYDLALFDQVAHNLLDHGLGGMAEVALVPSQTADGGCAHDLTVGAEDVGPICLISVGPGVRGFGHRRTVW